MRYQVDGLDASAATVRFVADAADADDARRQAALAGVVALDVRGLEAGPSPRAGGAFSVDLFCQELLAMLKAGVTLREALETLAAKEGSQGQGAVVGALLQGIGEGRPLSATMAGRADVFPQLLVESIRAAERTSDFAPALERFVRYRRQGRELRSKLVGAALYPLILLGVSAAVLLFLLGYVVPRFAQVYADLAEQLPLASRWLMHAGLAIDAHPMAGLAVVGLSLLAIAVAWRRGHLQRAAFSAARLVPRVHAALVTVERARLYRTLAMLLAGGLPMMQALALARGVVQPDVGARVDAARESIRQGHSFSDSLGRCGLASVVADRFFRVGERGGNLHEMIDRAADFHEEELGRLVDWVGRVIGPVMMLVMGGLIGAVVVLMYLPIFQLTEALQ